MLRLKLLSGIAGASVLAMTLMSTVAAAEPVNPCAGPAGASNPHCVDGVFKGEPPPEPLLPNLVTIDAPSSAVGIYEASYAAFGPEVTIEGVAGPMVLVQDISGVTTDGCEPIVGFPAGAIALIDRGLCPFVTKTLNAQAAGASAVVIVNNTSTGAIPLGTDPSVSAEPTIPAVAVSLTDGSVIKAGLPATGRVHKKP